MQQSGKETRKIVTPYAFTVSAQLLGKPLATPMRRGIAILIDVFLIGVLSTISALIFASFVALTFFRADSRLKKREQTGANVGKGAMHYTRLFLRGSGAIIIFFVAFMVVQGFDDSPSSHDPNDPEMGLKIAETVISSVCNADVSCLQDSGVELAIGMAETDIALTVFKTKMQALVDNAEISANEKEQTLLLLEKRFIEAREAFEDETNLKSTQAETNPKTSVPQEATKNPQGNDVSTNSSVGNSSANNSSTSIVTWVSNLMSDLGLSLGWAALYFSVFTAWSNGQTIGKRICGIKVVKLDGTTPNLWESFGRYGGYGAGFATGLMGFLQLYWDANRQAIQDKISETLVLRVTHDKPELEEILEEGAEGDTEIDNTQGHILKGEELPKQPLT